MHPLAPRRRRSPHRSLVSFAAVALAVTACGSGANAPASGSPVAVTGAPSRTQAASATVAASESNAPSPPPSLAPLAVLWQGSGPVSETTSTQAIAVDPTTDEVWVSVPFENLFWIFTSEGEYLESWGTGGTGPGQFDLNDHLANPDGFGALAFAPDGSFYVGDVGNHRVQKFDAERQFVKAWGTFGAGDGQFAAITALATDGMTVYIGDGGRGDIQAFDSNGTHLRTFGAGGSLGPFIAVDQAGNVLATNPGAGAPAVVKFDSSGEEVARFDASWIGGEPVGVAVDPQGHIFLGVGESDSPYESIGTYELGPDGQVIRGWSIGGGEALALSQAGDVLFVSRGIQLSTGPWPYIQAYAVPGG